jgi:hypothetical protein
MLFVTFTLRILIKKSWNHRRYFQLVIWANGFKKLVGPEGFLLARPTLFDNSDAQY